MVQYPLYRAGEIVEVYELYNDGLVRDTFLGLVTNYTLVECFAANSSYFVYDILGGISPDSVVQKVVESSISKFRQRQQ